MDLHTLWDTVSAWLLNTGVRVVISLVVLLVTFRLITLLSRWLTRRVEKHHADKTVFGALIHIGGIILKCVVVVCLVSYLGIDTSGITALVTSLGVCIGLAVNGALSNLAGGVLLLITRPFRVDDYIEACGYDGVVEDIRLTTTRIRTWDNKVVYIPNGTLSTSVIVNHYEKDIRRAEYVLTFAHKIDFPTIKALLLDHVKAHPYALTDPAPVVRINGQADGKLSVQICVWSKTEHLWDIYYDLHASIHALLLEHDITLAAPKLDVNVTDASKQS